ncbi:MAG: cytochrome c [Altibacter sp.]|uniref:c-type cytochrome n=1 Tax=Altibacter sp. TaxID=2024823 RepID=UPI001E16BCAA|nr:cytochrome c [Altibacter sp.]MBZ0327734.1 cytochrome c [Altibacter sp.]
MKIFSKRITVFMFFILSCSSQYIIGQDGEALFKQNCTACHKLGKKFLGPDLLGVTKKRDKDWVVSFIKSSQTMIKAGDSLAVALFKENNEVIMNDQPGLSNNDINAILAYIDEETAARTSSSVSVVEEAVEIIPIEYTEEDVKNGHLLFSGKKRFANKGTSCISCHHIDSDELISGGILAKDLTAAYSRMGDAGLVSIIGTPPFPVMAAAYKNNALDSLEVIQLSAYLKHVDEVKEEQQTINNGNQVLLLGGGGGLVVLFLVIELLWRRRLKRSVKHDIYNR